MQTKIVFYLSFYRERKLEDLVMNLRRVLKIEDDTPFIPKIILGKTKIPSKQMYFLQKKTIEQLDIQVHFPTDSVNLYESILGGKKPVFIKKVGFPLSSE